MKKILSLLILIPSISLSQYVPTENTHKVDVTVKKEQSVSESINDGVRAGAAARTAAAAQAQARAAASAAMTDSSVETIVPLEVELNNYEKVALVGITYANLSTGSKISTKSTYNNFEQLFANSMLQVLNPYEVDKRKARKNNRFLREIKDPKTLYMYYETSLVGVNLHRMLIVRDFENKIIYRAKVVNIDKAELVAPFVYF
jgi:hypothetical protein